MNWLYWGVVSLSFKQTLYFSLQSIIISSVCWLSAAPRRGEETDMFHHRLFLCNERDDEMKTFHTNVRCVGGTSHPNPQFETFSSTRCNADCRCDARRCQRRIQAIRRVTRKKDSARWCDITSVRLVESNDDATRTHSTFRFAVNFFGVSPTRLILYCFVPFRPVAVGYFS